MDVDRPLDEILRGATHVRVLRALAEAPRDFGISGREVARRAGVAHPTAAKVLAILREQGLVTVERAPQFEAFRLNRQHMLASPITDLLDLEKRVRAELISLLAAELARIGVRKAYLFGSVAKGEARARSDIDLAIDPPTHKDRRRLDGELDGIRDRIRARFGNELNVVVRAPAASARNDALWRRLLADAIPLHERAS